MDLLKIINDIKKNGVSKNDILALPKEIYEELTEEIYINSFTTIKSTINKNEVINFLENYYKKHNAITLVLEDVLNLKESFTEYYEKIKPLLENKDLNKIKEFNNGYLSDYEDDKLIDYGTLSLEEFFLNKKVKELIIKLYDDSELNDLFDTINYLIEEKGIYKSESNYKNNISIYGLVYNIDNKYYENVLENIKNAELQLAVGEQPNKIVSKHVNDYIKENKNKVFYFIAEFSLRLIQK